MQNVMDEAQQLMNALGMDSGDLNEEETDISESIVIDGFSIDDDDEEEAVAVSSTRSKESLKSVEMNTSSRDSDVAPLLNQHKMAK